MVKIKQRIVSKAIQNRVTYGGVNKRTTLTVHQTGNTRVGANAEMHARLQENGNSRAASWMFQSDDTEIIQSFPLTAQTWHASDGRGNGNLNSISWEICINSDGNYVKSLELAAKGIAQVLKDNNLTVADLRQHYDWSRKNCPAQIRAGKEGIGWNDFKAMVQKAYDGKTVTKPKPQPKPQPKQPAKPKPKKTAHEVAEEIYRGQGDWGNNPERRKKLTERGYSADEVQGIVNRLAAGSKQPAKPKPKPKAIAKGNRVRVSQSAKKYVTGENIPNSIKGKTYTVQQTRTQNGVKQVLLKEILSWVRESDVTRV